MAHGEPGGGSRVGRGGREEERPRFGAEGDRGRRDPGRCDEGEGKGVGMLSSFN